MRYDTYDYVVDVLVGVLVFYHRGFDIIADRIDDDYFYRLFEQPEGNLLDKAEQYKAAERNMLGRIFTKLYSAIDYQNEPLKERFLKLSPQERFDAYYQPGYPTPLLLDAELPILVEFEAGDEPYSFIQHVQALYQHPELPTYFDYEVSTALHIMYEIHPSEVVPKRLVNAIVHALMEKRIPLTRQIIDQFHAYLTKQ